MDDKKNDGKQKVDDERICAIYTSSNDPQGGKGTWGFRCLMQQDKCMKYAAKYNYTNQYTYFINGRKDMTSTESLRDLFGVCFDPTSKIEAVIIMERELLIDDKEIYAAIEDRLNRIGIKLLVTKDEDGIGVEDCLTDEDRELIANAKDEDEVEEAIHQKQNLVHVGTRRCLVIRINQ